MDGYSADICIKLLNAKRDELLEAGLNRYPARSDFAPDEVCAIKAYLGPWPRALEAAGLKEARAQGSHRTSAEKRIESKRRLNEARRNMKINGGNK